MAAALAFPITLYEITDHLTCLYEMLDLAEDEHEKSKIELQISQFEEAEIRKVDSVCSYLAFAESQVKMHAEEAKRHQARKQAWEGRIERLEASIQRVMEMAGKQKLDGRSSTLALRACPASVEVISVETVPEQYIRTKVEISVDKTSAARALKLGTAIPGLKLITDKKTVVRR